MNPETGRMLQTNLGTEVQNWPTPQAFDEKDMADGNRDARKAVGGCRNLGQEAPSFPQAPATSTGGDGSPCPIRAFYLRFPQKRRLNFRFVQWLMGFPEGWL